MRVLALDFGGKTGWAVGSVSEVPTFGTWHIAPARGDSPGVRYINLRANLAKVLAGFGKIDLVCYEQCHHRGGAATEYAAGCATHVQAWCAENGIAHTSVHSATLKVHATGSGRAYKDAMGRAATAKWDKLPLAQADDNAIDALWVLDWALNKYGEATDAR